MAVEWEWDVVAAAAAAVHLMLWPPDAKYKRACLRILKLGHTFLTS